MHKLSRQANAIFFFFFRLHDFCYHNEGNVKRFYKKLLFYYTLCLLDCCEIVIYSINSFLMTVLWLFKGLFVLTWMYLWAKVNVSLKICAVIDKNDKQKQKIQTYRYHWRIVSSSSWLACIAIWMLLLR